MSGATRSLESILVDALRLLRLRGDGHLPALIRDAAIAYTEAETEQDFQNAWARLRAAAKGYTFSEAA